MNLAVLANDLQNATRGRFTLGLGSQIKPHITKRFSMPWSHPAPRMREMILAIRAIWKTWATGEPLAFRGEFYTHTLMTPFFDPGPNEYGNPSILLAGVGTVMTEVAGEVADGFLAHAFTTERYLPRGLVAGAGAGRGQGGQDAGRPDGVPPGFVVTGFDEESTLAAEKGVRQQIAFYASTPAYRPVLELHGWGDLQSELNTLSKRGEWVKMGELIDDDVLMPLPWCARWTRWPGEVLRRFGARSTASASTRRTRCLRISGRACWRGFGTEACRRSAQAYGTLAVYGGPNFPLVHGFRLPLLLKYAKSSATYCSAWVAENAPRAL